MVFRFVEQNQNVEIGDECPVKALVETPRKHLALLLALQLVFILPFSLQAQPSPRGQLLDATPVSEESELFCAVYSEKQGKVATVLTRSDGNRHLGKAFWTQAALKKALRATTQSIKELVAQKASAKQISKAKKRRKGLRAAQTDLFACLKGRPVEDQPLVRFGHVKQLLQTKCMNCHGVLDWQNDESFYVGTGRIVAGNLEASPLYTFLSSNPEGFQPAYMPKGQAPLSSLQLLLLGRWINELTQGPSGPPGPEPTPSATLPPGVDPEGATLYGTYCASCHGPLASSAKFGKTAEQIREAMRSTPQMLHLRLSDDQIQRIASALAGVKPPLEGVLSVRALSSVNEGNPGTAGKLNFEVSFKGSAAAPFSVGYVTSNGTALADSDYVFSAGTLQFEGKDGETKLISIEILADSFEELNESLFVDIGGVSVGSVRIDTSTAQGLILNDDAAFNATPVARSAQLRMAFGFNQTYLDALGVSHATAQGDAVFSANARVGSAALELDEGSDYVTIPGQVFAAMSNLSVTSWVYWENSTSTTSRIFDFGSSIANAPYVVFTPRDTTNRCRFEVRAGGVIFTLQCSTGVVLPANRWVHLALTFDSASDEMRIYFDGQQVASRAGATFALSSINFGDNRIGQNRIAGSTDFRGRIDELLVWDAALTQAEIAQVLALTETPRVSAAIDVRLNGVSVANGSKLDLGNTAVGQETMLALYIHNLGAAGLALPATPKVRVAGKHVNEFEVLHQPWPWQSLLTNNTFAVFSLRFAPTIPGDKSATLLIENSDQLKGNFAASLAAKGTGDPLPEPPKPGDSGTPLAQGQYLYAINCSSCHGPIERSQKKGTTVTKISAALTGIAQMRALTLTAPQVELITLALNSTPPPSVGASRVESAVVNVGTGSHIQSILSDIFLPDDAASFTADDTSIKNSISERILGARANGTFLAGRLKFFGGRCDRFDDGCQSEALLSSQRPVPNVVRTGSILSACDDILRFDRAVDTAVSKARLSSSARVDRAASKALYELFFPGREIPEYFLDVLSNYTAGKANLTPRDHWRFQLHLLCASSGWEVN